MPPRRITKSGRSKASSSTDNRTNTGPSTLDRPRADSSIVTGKELDVARKRYETDISQTYTEETFRQAFEILYEKATEFHQRIKHLEQKISEGQKVLHAPQLKIAEIQLNIGKDDKLLGLEREALEIKLKNLNEDPQKKSNKEINLLETRIKEIDKQLQDLEIVRRDLFQTVYRESPEYQQQAADLPWYISQLAEQVKEYHHFLVQNIESLIGSSSDMKSYIHLNSITSRMTFIKEQYQDQDTFKSTEERFHFVKRLREIQTTQWNSRITSFFPEGTSEHFSVKTEKPSAIQTDAEYQERLETLLQSQFYREISAEKFIFELDAETIWHSITYHLKDHVHETEKKAAQLKKCGEICDFYDKIIEDHENITSPIDAQVAQSNYVGFAALTRTMGINNSDGYDAAKRMYKAGYEKVLKNSQGYSQGDLQEDLEKCRIELEKARMEREKIKSDLDQENPRVIREKVIGLAKKAESDFKNMEEVYDEIQCLHDYFSLNLDQTLELIKDTPNTIVHKRKEEVNLDQISPSTQESGSALQQSLPELATTQLRTLSERDSTMNKMSMDAQRLDRPEQEEIEQFAQRFSTKHHDIMRAVAEHTLRKFGVPPDRLSIAPNGDLYAQNAPDVPMGSQNLNWDSGRAIPTITGQKQKIHIIADLEPPASDSARPQKLVLFVKSRFTPEQSHVSKFAEGTPMLIGGTIEASDLLQLSPDGNRNLFLATIRKEVDEETHGKYTVVNTTLDSPQNSLCGKWTYNIARVTLKEATDSTAGIATLSLGADESQGTVVIDTGKLAGIKGTNNLMIAIARQAAAQNFRDCEPPETIGNDTPSRWLDFFYSTCMRQLIEYLQHPERAATSVSGLYVPPAKRQGHVVPTTMVPDRA